jgi:apolipoprotein N-acyltransferase
MVWAFFLSLSLYFFSFPPFGFFPFAWIAPLPLLLVLKESSGKNRFSLWWLWGSLFFLASLHWLPGTMEVYGPTASWAAYSAYMALVLYLGLFWGVWGWWSYSLIERSVPSYIAFSFVLAFLELVRGRILTGFPWLLAAHSQCSFLPFIQGASIFGVYGVSFLLAWVWGILWEALAKGFRCGRLMPLLFPLCMLLWGYIRTEMPLPGGI